MDENKERDTITPITIWNSRQNHPELVVQDCIDAFGLTEDQAAQLRFILINRGVNKWLLNRWYFIQLKHEIKALLQAGQTDQKTLWRVYARMQEMAKSPRWVEWGTHVHKKMGANIRECTIRGKRC